MTKKQIEETLLGILKNAEEQGLDSITIISGELNKRLPYTTEEKHSYNHACCRAMNKFFDKDKDELIRTSNSGQTSKHIIKYGLPRFETILDSELNELNLDNNIETYKFEKDYDNNYPRKYVTDISITVEEWKELLSKKNHSIFHESDIEYLKKIYVYPHHAVTCKELADSEGKAPQAYNKPVVALARRIQQEMQLPKIFRDDGKEVFWRVIFWGRRLTSNLFEWKIRPELALAMSQLWPELDVESINKQEDERYVEDTNHTKVDLPDFSEYLGKPRKKTEKIFISGKLVTPRDRKIAFNALAKSRCQCEYNNSHESFICKSSGRKYLELHHLIPLTYADEFDYSIDIEENIVSLCSNCHNEIHYGIDAEKIIKKLFKDRKDALSKAGINITLEWLLKKYK